MSVGPRGPTEAFLRETDVQWAVRELLESLGFWTYALSQGRSTRQSAGLPDLWAMHPQAGGLWVECKRPGGKLGERQQLFADRCKQAGVGYLCCSSLETVHAYLERLGLIAHPAAG